MTSRAFGGQLAPQRRDRSCVGAVLVAGLPRNGTSRRGAPGRVVQNAATLAGNAVSGGSRALNRGHATRLRHPRRPQAAADPQPAHRDKNAATGTLWNTIALRLAVSCERTGEHKCHLRIFTCDALARKPTQLGADGRACGARGGAARLRRPPAAQANVGRARELRVVNVHPSYTGVPASRIFRSAAGLRRTIR